MVGLKRMPIDNFPFLVHSDHYPYCIKKKH